MNERSKVVMDLGSYLKRNSRSVTSDVQARIYLAYLGRVVWCPTHPLTIRDKPISGNSLSRPFPNHQ